MKIHEINNKVYYALFAADGTIQTMTLAPSQVVCEALISAMIRVGICQDFEKLMAQGYEIKPFLLTVKTVTNAKPPTEN